MTVFAQSEIVTKFLAGFYQWCLLVGLVDNFSEFEDFLLFGIIGAFVIIIIAIVGHFAGGGRGHRMNMRMG